MRFAYTANINLSTKGYIMKGKKVIGWIHSLNRKAKILSMVAVGLMLSAQASALEVVTQDGTTGAVTFAPDAIVSPITTAIITTICSVAGIFLIVIGCRWVFRLCRGGG